MRTIDNILYLEYAEYVPAIVTEINYKNQQFRKTIKTSGRGGNGNTVLIQWQTVPKKYQLKYKKIQCENRCEKCQNNINDCDFNVYEAAVVAPLKNRLVNDYKARDFYTTYRYGEASSLTPEHVEAYTKAAEWLNMLQELSAQPKLIKTAFNLSITDFWSTVSKILKSDNIALPYGYKRLREKLDTYKKDGYATVISGKFGNQNTAKINDDLSKSILLNMISHPHQFDDIAIVKQYNKWALKNGYKSIVSATVGVQRRKHDYLTKLYREGEGAYNNKYNVNIPGKRPSAPLYQINSDDNNVDVFLLNIDTKNYHNRLVLIVVMDVFNDYILGYSWRIADAPIIEMVYAAYLDAMYHVKSLTGDWHLWHELKADGWAGKTLKPFYDKQGLFIKPKFNNAKGKLIEQAFGEQWHDVLKEVTGYSGHNISAKTRGVNQDIFKSNKKEFHTTEDAGAVAEYIVSRLRNLDGKVNKNVTRQQEWLSAWNMLEIENKRKVSDVFVLDTFGKQHLVRDKKYPNQITNNGIIVQIDNKKHQYFIDIEIHQQLIGTSIRIVYDGIDMSRVLITNDKNVRMIAYTIDAIPRAAKDFKIGDRKRFNEFLDMKCFYARKVVAADEERRLLLKEANIDTEAMLQAGSGHMIKELGKYAESAYLQKTLSASTATIINDDEEYDDLQDM